MRTARKRLANIERIAESSRRIAAEELGYYADLLASRDPDVFDDLYNDIDDILRRLGATQVREELPSFGGILFD